ncbi:hypothetical protein REC12_12190 [Desulfosporosinus sp. PR]|nr:hypothetical protein [Desulfosporosinus sp. PR]
MPIPVDSDKSNTVTALTFLSQEEPVRVVPKSTTLSILAQPLYGVSHS